MTERTIRPRKSEVVDLQSAMRDVQVSIASYHNASAGIHSGPEALETPARATVAFIQKVNEVMRTQLGQGHKYKRIFDRQLLERDPGAELIEAFRYVRHVMSHQLFRARPATTGVVGGLGFGFLSAAHWVPIPRRVDQRLHDGTRALRKHYDRRLVGESVVDTFLDAARYFATICPLIVHRDHRDEWSGFPLRSQPGVGTRLHPAEPILDVTKPASQAKHARWLDSRPPGGDFRLICGRATVDSRDLFLGLTFRESVSFSPFVERAEQVTRDIKSRYSYYHCTDSSHLRYEALGPYRHGATITGVVSDVPFNTWIGHPIRSIRSIDQFMTFMTREEWIEQVRIDLTDHLVRRSQRLAAVYPPT